MTIIKRFWNTLLHPSDIHRWTQWETFEQYEMFRTYRLQKRKCTVCGLAQEVGLEPSARPCSETVITVEKKAEGNYAL